MVLDNSQTFINAGKGSSYDLKKLDPCKYFDDKFKVFHNRLNKDISNTIRNHGHGNENYSDNISEIHNKEMNNKSFYIKRQD
jgi:hypothetical protein